MRNVKKWAAVGMTATMLLSSASVAFAAEGGDTGNGEYEGFVEKVSVFTVDVPTNAATGGAKGFDFFVDPNNLLKETGYNRITGATAADFETDTKLFFERTPDATATPAVVKYGKDSESITFENQSSYDVDVAVTATLSGVDGITLGEVDDTTTDPTIYLAVVTPDGSGGTTKTIIDADGASVTGQIGGVDANFKVVYDDGTGSRDKGYYYDMKDPSTDGALADWKTYSFYLTGNCGGEWTAAQANVAPKVTLVWKVTDTRVTPEAPSVATTAETYSVANGLEIPVSLGAGNLAATGVAKVLSGSSADAVTNEMNSANWSYANGKVTITGAFGAAAVGKNRFIKIVFDDAAGTETGVITVTVAQ